MEFLANLWLPILLTGIALFFLSSVFWTVLPFHDNDFEQLPDEDEFMRVVGEMNIPPGRYIFPRLTHQDHKDAEKIEKYKQGPRGLVNLWGLPNMGRNLGLTFLFFLIIAFVTGYIAWEALGADASFMKVLQIVGAISMLVHCSTGQLNAIWFPKRTIFDFFDGIVYGIVTGLIFALLWPAAAVA